MKWFKHISDSLDDPFIYELLRKHRHAGYAVFFGMLEIVSRECHNFDGFVSLKLRFCARKLSLSCNKLSKILQFIAEQGRFELTLKGDILAIRIPKLKELSDEYTKRKLPTLSRHSPKKSGLDKDIDKEEDKDIFNTSEKAPAKAGTPQAEFIKNWADLYQSKTGQIFKADKKDFILVAGLLKKFSGPVVLDKARLLFEFCNNGGTWFAKSMADFTIGKLSSRWNEIIEEAKDNGRQAGVSRAEMEDFMAGRE